MMNIDNGEIVYEEDYYYIHLDRIPDELALLEWVHHLLVTKNFPDHYNLADFIETVCDKKGWQLYRNVVFAT